jgi:hypothetical protein
METAYAQSSAAAASVSGGGILGNVDTLFGNLNNIVGGSLATLLMTVAFIAFLAAVINFIIKRRDGKAGLEDAKNMLAWSVVGLFVMVSIWGLVNFLAVALTVDKEKSIAKPQTVFTK